MRVIRIWSARRTSRNVSAAENCTPNNGRELALTRSMKFSAGIVARLGSIAWQAELGDMRARGPVLAHLSSRIQLCAPSEAAPPLRCAASAARRFDA